MLRRIGVTTLIALCLFCVLPSLGSAQVSTDVAVSISPENPGPNQNVYIKLSSFSFNIETAQVDWTVDGVRVAGGVGAEKYMITTKDIGVATRVYAIITPLRGVPIRKDIVITPMSVDILWEATDSAVPPLYRGKALPTSESRVKFTAIPQVKSSTGALVGPENFVYSWRENNKINNKNDGYGKSSVVFPMDYLNTSKLVSVSISSRTGSSATAAETRISAQNPKVLWYTVSPLYGPLFDFSIGTDYTIDDSDTSILAFPYFFSPGATDASQLAYSWKLNDSEVQTPGMPNILVLHRDNDDEGDAVVELGLKNTSKLFQQISSKLNLHLK